MWVTRILTVGTALFSTLLGGMDATVYAQEYEEYPLEARVWMDRGHEPVLQRGEAVRLYYRVSEDAFVAIFHIDTNGTARMVFPTSPQENHFARGGRDYRVLFPGSTYWYVNDDPGMGYFFAVASPQPFDFSDLRYSHYDGGWDLSFVGRQVYQDPYLAMDDYVAALVPDWEVVPYGLDFTAYHVERRYEYPRFMCYDCHGFRPFSVWNPYHYACASFRVVIYNDPYYYPVSRYRGTRVVYVQPRRGVAHFGFKERAAGEPGTPQVVVRSAPGGGQPGVAGTEVRRAQPRSSTAPSVAVPGTSGAPARRSSPAAGSGGATAPRTPSSRAGAAARRGGTPESVPLTAPVPGANNRGSEVRRITDPAPPRSTSTRGTSGNGPVLERRPTNGSSAVPRTVPSANQKTPARPSARVRSGSGGSPSTPPPNVRTGGTASGRAGSTRLRGGTTSRTIRPTVRSGTSRSSPSQPTVRSGGSSSRSPSRPTVRSGGSQSRQPTVRSGGAKPPTSRPTVRSSGGSRRSPPAATRRAPVKKKRSGGGEA